MAEVVEELSNPERPGGPVIDEALKGALDAYYAQYGVRLNRRCRGPLMPRA